MTEALYKTWPYRYAKNKVVVLPISHDGFKTKVHHLCEAKGMGARYVNRAGGYVMSPSAEKKLQSMLDESDQK